jgi:hypothetical protein
MKIFMMFIVLVMWSGYASAQQRMYGDVHYYGPSVVPYGTTRIQSNFNGSTFYGPNGLNGRSYNSGNGQMIYGRVNGHSQYMGRTYSTGNGGFKFQPAYQPMLPLHHK